MSHARKKLKKGEQNKKKKQKKDKTKTIYYRGSFCSLAIYMDFANIVIASIEQYLCVSITQCPVSVK
jgi:hypothetical protein